MNADMVILLGDGEVLGPTWAGGGGGEADEDRLIRRDLGLAAITFISRHIFRHIFRVPAIFRVEKMAGRKIGEQ